MTGTELASWADAPEPQEGAACACCVGGHRVSASPEEGGGVPAGARDDMPSYSVGAAASQLARDGISWAGQASGGISFGGGAGQGARVTYGFLAPADVSDDAHGDYRAMNADEIAMVEYAMGVIAGVADIVFVRQAGAGGRYLDDPSHAQIVIDALAGSNGGLARTSWSGRVYQEAQVSIGEAGLEELGSYAFRTALHEVSHAVGLSHPGDYDKHVISYAADAEYREDSAQYTVMSYFGEEETGADYGGQHSTGLMLHDVAALQHLYGANDAARAGDTVYGFGASGAPDAWDLSGADHALIGAIWDAGGRDRLDLSGYAQDQRIDLRQEAFSDVGGLTANVAIAAGAVIEDARGGTGDDWLHGNAGANVLAGGAGDDALFAGGGDDVIYGDAGPVAWG